MQVSASAALALQRDWHWLKKPLHDVCAETSTASVPSSASANPQEVMIFLSIVCPFEASLRINSTG
ncbi:MAG TPA: hypothetical protein VGQ93_08085 [Lysobacter sp.]|jgi:hypothetical protein|nr:hypothetical protein [Lysobacter sp.]